MRRLIALLLSACLFLLGCHQASLLNIDYVLTDRMCTLFQGPAVSGCQAVEVYTSGEKNRRVPLYMSIEDLRDGCSLVARVSDPAGVWQAITCLTAGEMGKFSSTLHYPPLDNRGTTFHVLFCFDGSTRFAYFEVVVPRDRVPGDVKAIVLPRSDSGPFPGDDLAAWIHDLAEKGR